MIKIQVREQDQNFNKTYAILHTIYIVISPSPIISLPCHWASKSWFWILLILLALFELFPWICQNWYMDFSKLLHGFAKIDALIYLRTWICRSCYMDLLKFLHKFCLCISRTLPIKLKFDLHFKARWSFCFELMVLNESTYWMPWVRCAFGNFCLYFL